MDLDDLLAGATSREVLAHPDGKSGASFERVVIDGERFVVKHLHVDDDWIMRATGDVRCRPLVVWNAGWLDRLPASIDHAVVGVADGLGRNGWGAAILMRDVSPWLVPEGDDPLDAEQEARLLDHMAELHATFWGCDDDPRLAPQSSRYTYFTPLLAAIEVDRGTVVPRIVGEGWARCASIAPDIVAVRDEPWALIDALAELPQTFLHGDWKLGNLGSHPDGRTILLDWATPGVGTCVSELGWWLALNTRRLPSGKDGDIELYRAALEHHGVDTSQWWDRGIDLALLGALVQFGWEKAFEGPGPELDWWLDRARAGLARL